MIRIIRIAGLLFIGMTTGRGTITKPRTIAFVPMKDGRQGIQFQEMPGTCDEMTINEATADLSYCPTDESFINAYREAVTGLTLAKAMPKLDNVVGIHGRVN